MKSSQKKAGASQNFESINTIMPEIQFSVIFSPPSLTGGFFLNFFFFAHFESERVAFAGSLSRQWEAE